MLTVDFDRLDVGPGTRLLDLGCGAGRHAFEAWRRGAHVAALDLAKDELEQVRAILGAMADAGELPASSAAADRPGVGGAVCGDAARLPFPDGAFDTVIASEVLEHVWDDEGVLAELVRVLRPGGRLAVTVPTRGPERICWALDHRYHDRPGGHVRIYRRRDLESKLERAGLWRRGSHHAHALHSPYWWLKCAVGVDRTGSRAVDAYHRMLVWQITHRPAWLDRLERTMDPVLGKSLVCYAQKPGP